MQMKLLTNNSSQQNQNIQKNTARSFQNQNSFIKLGNSGQKKKLCRINSSWTKIL